MTDEQLSDAEFEAHRKRFDDLVALPSGVESPENALHIALLTSLLEFSLRQWALERSLFRSGTSGGSTRAPAGEGWKLGPLADGNLPALRRAVRGVTGDDCQDNSNIKPPSE